MVVGRGDEHGVNALADLVEHDAVVGEDLEPGRVLAMVFQELFHFRLPFLIRVHDGHEIILALGDQPIEVSTRPATSATDLDAIELLARLVSEEKVRAGRKGRSGKSACRQRGLFKEGTAAGVHFYKRPDAALL